MTAAQMNPGKIAATLLRALDGGETIPSIAETHPGFGWEDAYEVAARVVQLRLARGERPVGRKIGFTNRNIWAEYGATSPIWAHVYDCTLIRAQENQATLSLKGSVRPRIEPEIAFGLGAPVPAGCRDPASVLACVEWIAPSFEIVDCHFADWKFKAPDSAADFSFHWRLVIGTPRAVRADEIHTLVRQLAECEVTLSRNDRIMDRGVGANALDHPALALAFLADAVARQPQFELLKAGEIVTTGTLTAALPIRPGETWRSRYEGLPGVTGLHLVLTE
jgi:2-oxo-3-hexenedioate decarboxylase